MKKIIFTIITVLVLTIALNGCGGGGSDDGTQINNNPNPTPQPIPTPPPTPSPVNPPAGSIKNGVNSFLSKEKTDGVYLQKYNSSNQIIGELKVQTGIDFFVNYTFSPETSSNIFMITTKAALDSAGKPDHWDNNGESFLSVINANDLSLTKTVSILPVGRIMDAYHFKNDTFFQVVTLVSPGQYLKRIDLDGDIIINKPLWASDGWVGFIVANADNVYLAGNKYYSGFGERACVTTMDRNLNVLGESVHKPFELNVGADTINSFIITSEKLLMSVTFQENATTPDKTLLYGIDFATGTFTPIQ